MKHTQEQMQATINEWKHSGLSKRAFCRDRGITYQTFHYWYKRVSSISSGFTELNVVSHPPTNACELSFTSGVRMVFHNEPSVSWLLELIR
ncbi:MAG: hypothetical protein ABI477_05640 [Chryseolinea sp.]